MIKTEDFSENLSQPKSPEKIFTGPFSARIRGLCNSHEIAKMLKNHPELTRNREKPYKTLHFLDILTFRGQIPHPESRKPL